MRIYIEFQLQFGQPQQCNGDGSPSSCFWKLYMLKKNQLKHDPTIRKNECRLHVLISHFNANELSATQFLKDSAESLIVA